MSFSYEKIEKQNQAVKDLVKPLVSDMEEETGVRFSIEASVVPQLNQVQVQVVCPDEYSISYVKRIATILSDLFRKDEEVFVRFLFNGELLYELLRKAGGEVVEEWKTKK